MNSSENETITFHRASLNQLPTRNVFQVRLDGRVLQPSRNNFLPSRYFFFILSFRELNFLPYCSCSWNKLKGDFLLVKILKKFLNLKSEKVKIINQKWSCMNRKVFEEWDTMLKVFYKIWDIFFSLSILVLYHPTKAHVYSNLFHKIYLHTAAEGWEGCLP